MSGMTAVAVEPFQLRRDDGDLAAGVQALSEQLKRATLDTVLAKANRVLVRKGATGAGAFQTMKPRPVDWYCFDADDNAVRDWYPQGLTCASDAGTDGGTYVVSWYYKPETGAERGVRLSFLNTATLRYRHVLLVRARPDGDIAPIDIHAGGIAWYGDLLYVADTAHGMRVFDTRQIFEVDGDGKTTIGRKGGVYNAFGYRYVMPQTGAWTSAGGARFSFAAIDRTTPVDTLISGEYVDTPGTYGRWPAGRWSPTAPCAPTPASPPPRTPTACPRPRSRARSPTTAPGTSARRPARPGTALSSWWATRSSSVPTRWAPRISPASVTRRRCGA